ncbi:Uncharacterised protein [Mycobacteroides abscessus subsp. abscessus]|nr:Uncharacterised protein [Mycobacteroides abscessus subsp. abscessus]
MRSSHGLRSASVNGIPARIRSMFAAGWKSSPSAKGTPSAAARRVPTVVLPDPVTPITTTRGADSFCVIPPWCVSRTRSVGG